MAKVPGVAVSLVAKVPVAVTLSPVSTERSLTALPPLAELHVRQRFGPMVGRLRLEAWLLPAIMVGAAVNFFSQLGSSSYFGDEALSIEHSVPALGQVLHVVTRTENTPWTYFVALHEWLGRTGSQSEWIVRLPSAVAGVALVGAVYWMARVFVDRRAALGATALCAFSPLVLVYAREARVYVFAMLAGTVAVGATVRAARASEPSRRTLAVGGATAVLALWLHYTTVFVVLPLCVWLALQTNVRMRSRIAFAGACALAGALLAPLFIEQYRANPDAGPYYSLTLSNAVGAGGTPFEGVGEMDVLKVNVGGINAIRIVGVAVVVISVIAVLASKHGKVRERRLLVVLGVLAPIVLLIFGAAGKNVVGSRYTAIAAPFLLIAVAAAVSVLRRPAAAALLVAALAVSASGIIGGHRARGFYPPSRQAIDYISAHQRPEDATLVTPFTPDDVALIYYSGRKLRPIPQFIGAPFLLSKLRAGRHPYRLWIVAETAPHSFKDSQLFALGSIGLRPLGYRALSLRTFTTDRTFAIFLAVRTRFGQGRAVNPWGRTPPRPSRLGG